jgi:ferredoxin
VSRRVRFRFEKGGEVVVEAYSQLNLLGHAQIAERSLQSRCGGQCECSTCRVVLVSGRLSAMRPGERELLGRVGVKDPRVRLACQSFPEIDESEDDIVIEVPARRFRDAR